MPRRAGKAASRKARQRSVQRAARPASPQPPPAPGPAPTSAQSEPAQPRATAVPPVGTPDAREALSLDPPRRSSAPTLTSGASTLTGRERAEYHYVERDLRNIGILTAVMAVLLLLAWVVFSALNLTG
jgi:hypothetical protein